MTIKSIETLRDFTWAIPNNENLRLAIGTILDFVNGTNIHGRKMGVKTAIFTLSEYQKSLKPGCDVDLAITDALKTMEKYKKGGKS